jgi:tetratricopeptide (TPR) repeat protein
MSNNESSASSLLKNFLEKNVKILTGIVIVLIIFAVVVVLGSSINAKSTARAISAVDAVEYSFRKDADGISEADFAARQDKALEELEALVSKSGIAGVRANMLKAEILFEKKDYEASRSAWVKAADAKKAVYTAPICNYNAAVCSENLGDLDSALSYYEKAVKAEDFFLADHAYFSLGRVNEAKGNYDKAVEAYEKIGDLHPASKWAPLAKDRIIAVKANSSSAN